MLYENLEMDEDPKELVKAFVLSYEELKII